MVNPYTYSISPKSGSWCNITIKLSADNLKIFQHSKRCMIMDKCYASEQRQMSKVMLKMMGSSPILRALTHKQNNAPKGMNMAKRINPNVFVNKTLQDNEAFKNYRENLPEEPYDWDEAKVEGVTINGEPLDGHYFDRMIDSL